MSPKNEILKEYVRIMSSIIDMNDEKLNRDANHE